MTPLSAQVLTRDRAARSFDRSLDLAAQVLSASTVPPPPGRPVYGGEGLRGPPHMSQPRRYLYEGRMGTRGPSPLAHTTSYAVTRAFMRHRARVALYNSLFARSIVGLCSGVGDKIPPWGKGLRAEAGLQSLFFKKLLV